MEVEASETRGTIGGGRLEFDAIARARKMLDSAENSARMEITLGPESGQCCGGRVTLELTRGRAPALPPQPQVLIFGAGHVGRALARIMGALPFEVALYDDRADQIALASGLPATLTPLPETFIQQARPASAYLIATHDHGLDFLLTRQVLSRGDAAYIGLIGSATKLARFRREARSAGIDPSPVTCPIGGGRARDKRPQIIALFTAAEIAAALPVPDPAMP